MNTQEKRKLEALLTSKLDKARSAFKKRQQRKLETLAEELEKNPSKEVLQLTAKYVQITATFNKQSAEIEEKAKALGYCIYPRFDEEDRIQIDKQYDYSNEGGTTTYSAPPLQAIVSETRNVEQRFDELATDYTVAIWAESGDMASLLEKFSHEIESIA
ncbi:MULTISPECIES: hypothetical protein [Hyphomicrobiales]|uniref:hypothetical protein n=1 Tax=Hyphomicrobiales TaxID=356 RepID=UPI0032975BF7